MEWGHLRIGYERWAQGDDVHGTKGGIGESHGVHFWARWNGVGTLETSSTRGIVNILFRRNFLPCAMRQKTSTIHDSRPVRPTVLSCHSMDRSTIASQASKPSKSPPPQRLRRLFHARTLLTRNFRIPANKYREFIFLSFSTKDSL